MKEIRRLKELLENIWRKMWIDFICQNISIQISKQKWKNMMNCIDNLIYMSLGSSIE